MPTQASSLLDCNTGSGNQRELAVVWPVMEIHGRPAQGIANTSEAYCVDSRGMKEDNMSNGSCTNSLTQCP